MEIFNLQGVTSEFTVLDVALVLTLSFVLSSAIGWIYQVTHRGTSYTQSFVFTLVLNGMVVALVMLIVVSDIARAFSLVGALSIIRFRNAVKETRDVGFIFFTMAVGMAIGTRFYLLGIIATIFISLVIVLMNRFNWFSKEMSSQILRILVPDGLPFDTVFDRVFLKYTQSSDLISADTVESGLFTELTYSVGLKRSTAVEDFLTEIKKLNGNYQVSLITGYSGVDL
jgi:uncharacterized membrane protein YhiD involved in acid resistance